MSTQTNPVLQAVLSCPNLPTLPAVALQVLELTRNPQVGLNELGKVVQADPALSAKVLKTVNSSLYGLATQCAKIDRALSYLGLNAVKSLVLGFSLVDCTRSVSKGRGLDMQAHWRRATMGAAGARTLAQVTNACDPDEAFTAAVFSDIGVLATFLALNDKYSDVLETTENHADLAAVEQEFLGITHGEIGAELAMKWRLPAQYVDAIRFHHCCEQAPASALALTRIVTLGGFMAEALSGQQPRQALACVTGSMQEWFGRRPENLEELLGKVSAGAQDLARVFEKDIGVAPNIQQIMAEASEQAMEAQIATHRESDQLRVQNEELSIASVTDALTGAKNRKCFDHDLQQLQKSFETHGSPFGVVFLDADKFKSVNDRFGHPAGDAVLQILARRLTAASTGRGDLYRYGGEEFAVLLPATSIDAAAALAEILRSAVESPHFEMAGVPGAPPTLPVTISCGVAACDCGTFANGMAVVKAADESVYQSKLNGRNQVTVYDGVAPAAAAATSAVSTATQTPPGMTVRAAAAPETATRRILLLEDDALAAKLIQLSFVKRVGVEVVVVQTVEHALARVQEVWAGAVVDMNLPDGVGTEFIQNARTRGFAGPILALSADDRHRARALRSGATQFVDKAEFCRDLGRWAAQIEAWSVQRVAA